MAPVFKISDFGMGKKLPETDPDLQDPYVNDLNTLNLLPLMFSENMSVAVDFLCAQVTFLTNWYWHLPSAVRDHGVGGKWARYSTYYRYVDGHGFVVQANRVVGKGQHLTALEI